MLFALERVTDSTLADFAAALEGHVGMKRLESALLALLPTTERSLAEWNIWISFRGYALSRPALANSCRQRLTDYRRVLRRELESLRDLALIRVDLNLDQLADIVLAFYEGLGMEGTADPASFPPHYQQEMVKAFVASLMVRP